MHDRDDNNKMYRELAKRLTAKVIDNITQTILTGQAPDLYWKLESAILQALKYADSQGAERAKKEYKALIKDFDSEDGTSQN